MHRVGQFFATLWGRKYALLISFAITFAGLFIYTAIYLAEWRLPIFEFIDSIELRAYDTRCKIRGQTAPTPEAVIVAIDRKTVDALGSWPFSRSHFARLLDQLSRDGAKVVGFDINFPKPDEKSGRHALRQARQEYLTRVPAHQRAPAYLARLEAMEQAADTDRQFAEAIRRAGNVVLGQFFYFSEREVSYVDAQTQQAYDHVLAFGAYSNVRPLPRQAGEKVPPLSETFVGEEAVLASPNLLLFADAANYNFGYFNFFLGSDPVMRRAQLVIKYKQDFYPALDVQVLKRFLDVPDQEFGLFYNVAGVEYIALGQLRVPTDALGRMLINFRGPAYTFPHYSLADVAAGNFPPGTFTNKIVLVGPSAQGIPDFYAVPVQEAGFPGVEIHANVLDTILNQRFIVRSAPQEVADVCFILLLGLVLGAVLVRVRLAWTTPATLLVLLLFLLGNYFAFARYNLWLNLVVPAMVLVANYASISAFRALVEEQEKRKVRAAFQQYVPPSLIRELMKDPERLKLGGEERVLSIMFSDIRGFTALSERLSPLELTAFLNNYTDEMTEIIFRHWGTLDKFQGDAVMAFWGAPYEQDDHAARACAAGLDMVRRVDELRQQWHAQGKPEINIGLGINTGRAVVGNMGSRKRFNYTVLGDAVNLASRLEGVNKEYGTRIIVSETTFRAATDTSGLLRRRLSQYFGVSPGTLATSDAADRARRVALYLGHKLGLPAHLAREFDFGSDDDRAVLQAVARVEHEAGKDKKLRRFLDDLQRAIPGFIFRQLDWIRVKGKREPVAIYQLLDYRTDSNPWPELLDLFQGGLNAYRGRRWRLAIDLFELALEKFPDDAPAKLFLQRCQHFLQEEPEPAWDGVYEMKTK